LLIRNQTSTSSELAIYISLARVSLQLARQHLNTTTYLVQTNTSQSLSKLFVITT
jgi:hypothetical protein